MTDCTCAATTEGKWAGIHDPRCPAVAACPLCRGAGFVTYRDGVPQETFDVEKEEHLIEDCPRCKPPAATEPAGQS